MSYGNSKEYKREWYLKNRERILKERKAYRAANKELLSERAKRHREQNPDKVRAKQRESYQRHRDKALARVRKYQAANKEKISEKGKVYREKNKERIKAYYKQNKERALEHNRQRRAKIRGQAAEPYTTQDVLDKYGTDCYLCGKPIDLNANRHPGDPGWENGLHIEHVIPISKGGHDTIDNVRPSHGQCNLKKGTQIGNTT